MNAQNMNMTALMPKDAVVVADLPGVWEVARVAYATHETYEVTVWPGAEFDDMEAAYDCLPLGAAFTSANVFALGETEGFVTTHTVWVDRTAIRAAIRVPVTGIHRLCRLLRRIVSALKNF